MSTTMDSSTTGVPELSDDQLSEAVRALVAELVAKFPHASEAEVATMVSASAQSFADARITEFIPVLIGQEVDRQLRATTPRLAG
ncbi:MAG TPA: hypothetical protein VMX11_06045 [Actinomycetes bacterium]|nr:hypothetical protein [Actinomycetes bacterium]